MGKKIVLGLMTLVWVVLLGIFLFFLWNKGSGSSKNPEENEESKKTIRVTAEETAHKEDETESELSEEQKTEELIEEYLSNMPLEDKVSQLFFVQPEALTGVDTAVQASDMTKEALQEYAVGGIVMFSKNIQDRDQICAMLANLQAYSKYPLFLGVDEEGGSLVARVANSGTISVPTFPNMMEIGNTGNPEEAYEVGRTIGTYLKDLGFNLDFAPIADVLVNPENQVIGERAFGSDAELVAKMVKRVVEGLQEQEVSAVLKHFPGHGGTEADSHEGTAILNRTLEELRSEEFLPFQSGIEAGADMIMVGHISVPEVTGDDTPATLSETVITDLLRNELGFDGIIITDSMSMGAIVDHYGPGEAAVQVIRAGGDMILMPQDFVEARQAVLDAVDQQEITEERINESVRRILAWKISLGLIAV